jgi:pimeloyl-ACP methyl ester carboxylesterase
MERGTVVLLHGLARSAAEMRILEWRLGARGYGVCNIDYSTRVARIEQASDDVYERLRARVHESSPVHFVTHSLGGLVLRSLLDRHELTSAGRAVMLAPPNRGSELADRLRSLGLLARLLGPLAAQLGTRPEDLPQRLPRPTIPFGVIAGSRWLNPAGPLWLEGPHDGTLSVASTRLEGMSDHLVLPCTHTFIMNRAEVARQVDAFLQAGHFAHHEAESARSDSR